MTVFVLASCGIAGTNGTGSGNAATYDSATGGATTNNTGSDAATTETGELTMNAELMTPFKKTTENNPVMTQRFGADPYALVYNGRVYLYMTADTPSYNPDKTLKENTYGNINTINVISSDDLVNWTDHGNVYAAGKTGAASWGNNSWAPAAAYKNIDGKDKFFLYFANNGNGIAVLTADSPEGPFTDPLGEALISRDTPTCAEVTWLFDPAILMDDDGNAYIYFGGGVPGPDKTDNPGTARVAKLSDDMISLDGDPVVIENVPYLFEDSGINKIGDKYYYSYCSNFNVTPEATKEFGFENGEIVTMVSDSPMGPFTLSAPVLKNPQEFFGRGGNNHHCIFEFEGKWYITYHSRILEQSMGIDGGYRSTNIDELVFDEEGKPTASKGTKAGVAQVKALDPFAETKAVTMSSSAGVSTKQYGDVAKEYGSGDMILCGICDGAYVGVKGADFGTDGAKEIELQLKGTGSGKIGVYLDAPDGELVGIIAVDNPGQDLAVVKENLSKEVTGTHDVYFVFEGEGYEFYSWKFVK